MEDFKATVIIEYVSVAAELYVDGQNDGYIDFGASENYSKFGNTGEQVFTVELWVKLKYTSRFIRSSFSLTKTCFSSITLRKESVNSFNSLFA